MTARKVPNVRALREPAQGAKSHRTEWHYRIHRRLSIYVTWLLLHTPLTANQASLLSLAVGAASAGLVLTGGPRQALFSLVGFYAYFLLDKVDGEIARYRGQQSLRGIGLDYLGHMAIPPLLPLSVGGFLAQRTASQGWWLLGALAALSIVFGRAARDIPLSIVLHKAGLEPTLFEPAAGRGDTPAPTDGARRPGPLSRLARLARFVTSFWPGLALLFCAMALYALRDANRPVLIAVFALLCSLHLLDAGATAFMVVRRIDRRVDDCLRRIDRIRKDGDRGR